MDDVTAFLADVDRLADRLRALPQSRLGRGPAAEGLALARELALRAQRLEEPDASPRTLPDAGVFVVADQVAVAGHDLAHALGWVPSDGAGGQRVLPEAAREEAVRAAALVAAAQARCGL
ncbi:hypothetical protein [Streptomyces sp. NPDC057702]|uniref:hypothetical protein n=1 Tax=unclassified Streptomyces TaxID=2593676 RepID=UPI00369313BC